MVETDADGDAVVFRRPRGEDADRSEESADEVLSEMLLETARSPSGDGIYMSTYAIADEDAPPLVLWHCLATPLDAVGLQVWRGAALLADYVLSNAPDFHGATVVELGSGPGLGALAVARASATAVFATDIATGGVLTLCHRNVVKNKLHGTVKVRELDWKTPPGWLNEDGAVETDGRPFRWTAEDVDLLKHGTSPFFILAADTVYDNDLTAAFMRVAERLLSLVTSLPSARCIVALERRECFTLRDLDVTAPAYDYWRTLFGENRALRGRRVGVDTVPQRVQGYVRADTLELWVLQKNAEDVT